MRGGLKLLFLCFFKTNDSSFILSTELVLLNRWRTSLFRSTSKSLSRVSEGIRDISGASGAFQGVSEEFQWVSELLSGVLRAGFEGYHGRFRVSLGLFKGSQGASGNMWRSMERFRGS